MQALKNGIFTGNHLLPAAWAKCLTYRFIPPVRVSEILLEHHRCVYAVADSGNELHSGSYPAITGCKNAGDIRTKISTITLYKSIVRQIDKTFQKVSVRHHTDKYKYSIAII